VLLNAPAPNVLVEVVLGTAPPDAGPHVSGLARAAREQGLLGLYLADQPQQDE
jgi:hypothetical protein